MGYHLVEFVMLIVLKHRSLNVVHRSLPLYARSVHRNLTENFKAGLAQPGQAFGTVVSHPPVCVFQCITQQRNAACGMQRSEGFSDCRAYFPILISHQVLNRVILQYRVGA
ncbi:hypothetical protein D3C77_502740 [compost metagenome]